MNLRLAPGRRGFTTQEPWIPLVIVVLLAVIAFGTLKAASAESVRTQALEWLSASGKTDDATRKQFDAIWAKADSALLDKIAELVGKITRGTRRDNQLHRSAFLSLVSRSVLTVYQGMPSPRSSSSSAASMAAFSLSGRDV